MISACGFHVAIFPETKGVSFSESAIKKGIEDLFNGEKVNSTENRPALHVALRNPEEYINLNIKGISVGLEILRVHKQIKSFVSKLHNHELIGYSGKPIDTVINIGIGGSDLGPWMVSTALRNYSQGISVRYVSNIDGSHLEYNLSKINPETTLFIVASKTFTTQETIANAESAKKWLLEYAMGDENIIADHFVAVTANKERAINFGIKEENCFEMWDWVGGRFSLWSSIGLSIVCSIGWDNFQRLLNGAKCMDEHYRNSSFEENIPLQLALSSYRNVNELNISAEAIVPYSQYLNTFPAFVQQLSMESNGKSIDLNGNKVDYRTSPVVWGKAGTNSQHSFFQAIHQGKDLISTEFIGFIKQDNQLNIDHHNKLIANMIAQSEALMRGKSLEQVYEENHEDISRSDAMHRVFEGNKPVTTMLIEEFSPESLGSLIALYEHKTYTLGLLWNINPFDQWGVEYGKSLANAIYKEIKNKKISDDHLNSTKDLLNVFLSLK